MTVTYRADQETPSYPVEWRDRDGNLIDFSASYTFELKLVNQATGTVGLTKTTGITGAATSPNITAAWAAGELATAISVGGGAGTYQVHLTATTSGADRMFRPGSEPLIKIMAAV
jgi:hypothetical protein